MGDKSGSVSRRECEGEKSWYTVINAFTLTSVKVSRPSDNRERYDRSCIVNLERSVHVPLTDYLGKGTDKKHRTNRVFKVYFKTRDSTIQPGRVLTN